VHLALENKSDKQSEIYEYLKTYTIDRGYPPSVREICIAVGLKSTSTVHGHLSRLEKKGLIRRDPTKPRAIELKKETIMKKEIIDIPVIGKITAGQPILAVENIEDTFSIPINYVKSSNELFILNVSGEKLINFCKGIQSASPVDSFVQCEPWDMPGYNDQVIMAAGAFIQGASIELSADAPIREPYIAYLQGGLTFEHVKTALIISLSKIMK
jgi:DNA-binding transcriptional ArsR family regulator